MLKINKNKDASSFDSIPKSNLILKGILEREDLQPAIINSWDAFKNELGLPNAFLMGQEIKPDQATQDSLDLLAYDADDLSLVVIELKRGKDKLHLLQTISYAAMVARWKKETALSHINRGFKDYEEPRDLIELNGLSGEVKIILVAEGYNPEVIISADWLSDYGLKISAFKINLHDHQGDSLVSIEQRYPLSSLEDAYDSRRSNRGVSSAKKAVEWSNVIESCQYSFADRAIKMCCKLKNGEPAKKRFDPIVSDFFGFKKLNLSFRKKYVSVSLFVGLEESDEEQLAKLLESFASDVESGSWRDGHTLKIKTEAQFKELIALDERFEY